MKVEIWSDVVCPWCYIGKRRFEKALEQFKNKEGIEIEYKSFQLAPGIKTDPDSLTLGHIAEKYGVSIEEARQMMANVTTAAQGEGLDFKLENTIVANTERAHQVLHFAKLHGKQEQMKEDLLHAYFVENKNPDDTATLLEIGKKNGLDPQELVLALTTEKYIHEVKNDMITSQKIGIKGVPFFVFDRKYGVSGAQSPEVLLETLEKSFEEWEENNVEKLKSVVSGESCDMDGNCD